MENGFEEIRMKSEELMEGREEQGRGKKEFHSGYFVFEGPETENSEVKWAGGNQV